MTIEYRESLEGIQPAHLEGFFNDWARRPQPETHLRLLEQSQFVIIAWDTRTRRVVGFCTAISDGVLTAYIPYVEVLPDWQGQAVGSELTKRMLQRLKDFYAVDLLCDPGLQPFYSRFGMMPVAGMMLRRYERQHGRTATPQGAKPGFGHRLKRAWQVLRGLD